MRSVALRRIFAFAGWGLNALYWGARFMLDFIGYTTAPEDFDALQGKLPKIVDWLFSTPWWVPSLTMVVLTGLVVWVSWPRTERRYPTVVAGTKVILPAPKLIWNGHCLLSSECPNDFDRVIATGAPPHSIANIRYRVTATDGGETVFNALSPRIAIREVGSIDSPILEGVGFAEVQLNRQSEFEVPSTCDEPEHGPWMHIELWLVGWATT